MRSPKYSIIIPAHNEEERISATLVTYADVFLDSEIIVVLNGCTDGTLDCVRRISENYQNILYVNIEEAVGKGGAVRAGFLLARAPIIGYADADGATCAEEMRRLCDHLEDSSLDGVIGSRWMRDSNVRASQPVMRRIASRTFNLAVKTLFLLPYRDTQCGAKVFRLASLRPLLEQLETANLAFDVDLLYICRLNGLNVKEVPIAWNDVTGSRVHLLRSSAKMFASLLRLRLRESFVRAAIPIFDRFLPTRPIRQRNRLSVLIINWRDPKHPNAGGAEAYLFEIAKRIARDGHVVEWLTAAFPGAEHTEEYGGIRFIRVGNRFTVYAAAMLYYVRYLRDRFDFVIDSSNGIPFFSPLFSMKPKMCVVYHVHQKIFEKHLPWPVSSWFKWLEVRLVPLIYKGVSFLTISGTTREEMEQYRISARPIRIVRPGYDPALEPGLKAARPTIVYVGRLKRYKRVHLLVEAMTEIRTSIPDAVLRIVGTGDELASLQDLTERLGLSECVVFDGFVTDDEKKKYLQQAWVCVCPSEMEGWGITAVEAAACGTATVAFDVPGLREAIRHGFSGLLVPEGSDIAQPILDVLTNGAFRANLERGGIARAGELSWDAASAAVLDAIEYELSGHMPHLMLRDDTMWRILARYSASPDPFGGEESRLLSLMEPRPLEVSSSSP